MVDIRHYYTSISNGIAYINIMTVVQTASLPLVVAVKLKDITLKVISSNVIYAP